MLARIGEVLSRDMCTWSPLEFFTMLALFFIVYFIMITLVFLLLLFITKIQERIWKVIR